MSKTNEKSTEEIRTLCGMDNQEQTTRTRRLNHTGCLTRRGEGKPWIARWMYAGKIHTKSTRTTDWNKARKILDTLTRSFREDDVEDAIRALERQLEILRGKLSRKELALADVWETFSSIDDLSNVGESTLKGYAGNVRMMCDWMRKHGARNAEGITVELAGEYLKELQQTIGKISYNCRLVLFKRVWKALVRGGYAVISDTWENYEKQKGCKHLSARRALSGDEIKALVRNAQNEDMRLLVKIGIYTGMRLSDCASLRWEDVDMDGKIMHVTPIKTKRHGIKVDIPIHPELLSELEAARGRASGEYVSEDNAHGYKTGHITGKVSALFRECGIVTTETDANGKTKIISGFHSLRHTFVSNAINSGMNPMLVQAIVGHSSVDMTAAYHHADMDKIREGIEALKVA